MGRTKVLFVVALVLAPILLLVSMMMFFFVKPPAPDDCGNEGVAAFVSVLLNPSALTVKKTSMNADQKKIVKAIGDVIVRRRNDFPPALRQRATVIALITGTVESSLTNLDYGDHDSAGVFQQRPSQGWGTFAQVTNVNYAINKFLDVMISVPGWKTRSYGDVAQAVQRSGFPDHYALYVKQAEKTYASLNVSGVKQASQTTESISLCQQQTSTIDNVVEAALSRVNDPYSWNGQADGAGFVSWAFGTQDVKIPSSVQGLANYKGDDAAGTSTTWIPAGEVLSGGTKLQKGDLLFWSNKQGKVTRSDATSVGIYVGPALGALRVATYNVHGSSHTAKTGPTSGVQRIKNAARLIKVKRFTVVGLQELQADQRTKLMKLLGPSYGIYPKYRHRGINTENSVVWNKSQVAFVSGSSLRMPFYFGHHRSNIPLVKFRHLSSGQDFYLANTHDPAFHRYAKLRWIDAKEHAHDMDELSKQGLPIFLTGDFNSGYGQVRTNNVTYGGNRNNLTWCILTKSGTMIDGYDASKFPPRSGHCPMQTTRERGSGAIDHIYVSKDVKVSNYQVIRSRARTGSDHSVYYIDAGTNKTTQTKGSSRLGAYVGPKATAGGSIKVLPVKPQGFVGVLRVDIRQPQAVTGDGKWVLPVSSPYTLTASFGDCGGLWSHCHTGQDFANPTGTPIHAATSGMIVSAGWAGPYGNRTIIRGLDGSETWYAHQSRFALRSGRVVAGQIIGYIGATGNVTGPHLHFEVRTPDGKPVDPMAVLRKHGLHP